MASTSIAGIFSAGTPTKSFVSPVTQQLQCFEQFHEFLPDVPEDAPPVLERSVKVVGDRLQAVERKASLLAE